MTMYVLIHLLLLVVTTGKATALFVVTTGAGSCNVNAGGALLTSTIVSAKGAVNVLVVES